MLPYLTYFCQGCLQVAVDLLRMRCRPARECSPKHLPEESKIPTQQLAICKASFEMANLELHSKIHVLNGLVVPNFIKQEDLDKLKDLTLRDDDVYPKAGTTWTQYIVHLIHNGGKDDGKKISDAVPWIETGTSDTSVTADDLTPPRAFKSHMPYERMLCGLPNSTPCKYIYVARNPKDLATSFYHHYRAYHVPGMEWKEFFEYFLVEFGDYFDHVLSWWAHKDDDNVLFIKFEDLKQDPVTTIAQIATFMGYSNLSQEVIKDMKILNTWIKD